MRGTTLPSPGPDRVTERRFAETLLAEGARIALLDIDPESLKDTTSRFAGAFAVPVDVADADSVHDAIGAIEQEFGHLDILVNNAGIVRSSNFADLPVHEWNEVFSVNSTGPFLMSQAAMPLLRKGAAARGPQGTSAIVNITSVEAHIVISSSGHPRCTTTLPREPCCS